MSYQIAPLVTTGKPWRTVALYVFMSLLLLGLATGMLFAMQNKDGWAQRYAIMGISGSLGLVGIFLWYKIYYLDVLEVYADRLEIKSMFGFYQRTIFKHEINGWTEVLHTSKNKMTQHFDLTLLMGMGTYKIHSSHYREYADIKSHLTEGIPRDTEKEAADKRRTTQTAGYVCLAIAAMMLAGFGYNYLHRNDVVTKEQTVTVQGPAKDKPEVKKKKKKKHREHYVSFGLANYPEQTFSLAGTSFRTALVDDFVSYVNPGDTLFIETSPEDQQRLRASDPGIDIYRSIIIYSLRDQRRTYLTLEDYNIEAQRETRQLLWVFGIAGLVLAALGAWLVKKGAQ